MAIAKNLIVITAVAFFFFIAATASSDGPFIVAQKKVTATRLKKGVERLAVNIDIYNQGSSTAYDVSLTDDNWPQDRFNVTLGSTTKTLGRLDAGASISHTFTLESTVKGMFHASPAVIKFRVPSKSALQEAYSTPILPLDILADKPPEKKFEWRLLARYGSVVSVLSLVGVFVYVVAKPPKSNAAKGSKKRR